MRKTSVQIDDELVARVRILLGTVVRRSKRPLIVELDMLDSLNRKCAP